MDLNKTCETCRHWRASPGAFLGDCAVGAVYGRVAFDYAGCVQHSSNPPALTQQSETRGMTYQQWVQRIGGAKQ